MNHTLKKLTHTEALEEVYRLAPQIRDIDDLLAPEKMRWLPYTMFFQKKNYISNTINTDDYGFRISKTANKRFKTSDIYDKPVNLIVGSSTAMGTGASSDEFTLASRLAHYRDEIWLNFAARGYNSTQEVILFLMHQHRFKKIDRVVIVSGMNNLVLEGLPEATRSDHGQYYYSYEYVHYMTMYNEEQGKKRNSILQRLNKFLNEPEEIIITDTGIDTTTRIQRAADATARALNQWKALLAPYGASLDYVLQPLTTWSKDKFTSEEEEIINAVDSCPNNFWRLFGNILGKEVYQPFVRAMASACRANDVPFYDLNMMIKNSDFVRNNIFIDRLHFNDSGYDGIAKLINEQALSDRAATIAVESEVIQ